MGAQSAGGDGDAAILCFLWLCVFLAGSCGGDFGMWVAISDLAVL